MSLLKDTSMSSTWLKEPNANVVSLLYDSTILRRSDSFSIPLGLCSSALCAALIVVSSNVYDTSSCASLLWETSRDRRRRNDATSMSVNRLLRKESVLNITREDNDGTEVKKLSSQRRDCNSFSRCRSLGRTMSMLLEKSRWVSLSRMERSRIHPCGMMAS